MGNKWVEISVSLGDEDNGLETVIYKFHKLERALTSNNLHLLLRGRFRETTGNPNLLIKLCDSIIQKALKVKQIPLRCFGE